MRYSTVPRLSSIGLEAAEHAAASASSAASSSAVPTIASAASGTRITVGATAPSATLAPVTRSPSTTMLTPQPTTAMSISVRGMKRRYASPPPGPRRGRMIAATISPGSRVVRPGPAGISSTGASRQPPGPTMAIRAPAAKSAGTLSAAGEPLQRLPASVARDWIWVEPMRLRASVTPGQSLLTPSCAPSSAPDTAAPIRQPPSSAMMSRTPGIRLMSTTRSGFTVLDRSWTRRSVPPASTRTSPRAALASATASSKLSGAMYSILATGLPSE